MYMGYLMDNIFPFGLDNYLLDEKKLMKRV